ncbi:MAG TPA: prolyl aminopeptidase [Methylophilus sp.]|nr:prolyl aminopeptidase [Methylophilus sp.]HQQ34133.1 prolyl aminopeptidase [Methylophilus sp.]
MNQAANKLYPDINPYNLGWLNVSNLHQIYYEECGNPNGMPVVFLHGGPGSGCNPAQRRFFDPSFFRIVLFDQRGCGRSKPLGETHENTTDDLIADIHALRAHLDIPKWHVFGGSWGSTLALAYAIAYPQHTISLTLRGVFLSRPFELNWFLGEVKNFYPEAWQLLCDYLPKQEQQQPLAAYEKLVFDSDPEVSIPAAVRWNAFESSIMTLLPRPTPIEPTDGTIELARARVQIHYIRHHCFVGHRDILKEAQQNLADIPITIIQGRYDMVCPPITAWQLHQALSHARMLMVPDAGHSAMELGIANALVEATDALKSMLKI